MPPSEPAARTACAPAAIRINPDNPDQSDISACQRGARAARTPGETPHRLA